MIGDTMVIHPERVNTKVNFDACLLRTPRSIGIGTAPGVAAACLPTESPKHGEACWVAGWGTTRVIFIFNFWPIFSFQMPRRPSNSTKFELKFVL